MNVWAIITIILIGGGVTFIAVEHSGNDWCRHRASFGGVCGDGLSGGGYYSGGGAGN